MTKRILSLLLCLSLFASLLPMISFADNAYEYPVIITNCDTFIRASEPDTLFHKADGIVVHNVNNHTGNDRISFVEFDVSDYAYHIENSQRVIFSIVSSWDAPETPNPLYRFAVLPLEGVYKDIDLKTITYNIAKTVKDGDVSLVKYGDDKIANGEVTFYDATYLTSIDIDITDYCKSQTDGRLVLMIKGVGGAGYSFLSEEECGAIVHQPLITIEGEFTDTQNALYNVAEIIKDTFDGKCITSDVALPLEYDGYNIEWTALDPDHLFDDGTVVQRPSSNEPTAHCPMTFKVTAPMMDGAFEERTITIDVLNTATVPSVVTKDSDRVEYTFSESVVSSDGKAVMRLPLTGYTVGNRLVVSHGSIELCDYTYDDVRTELVLDVTDCASSITSQPFIITGDDYNNANPTPATITLMSESAAEEVFALWNYDFGDLTNVVSDLSLPINIGTSNISWSSSRREVLAPSGRIERAYAEDRTSHLTATMSGGDTGFEIGFNVNVVRSNTSLENGKYVTFEDPMFMSDEAFFGKWDDINLTWEVPSVLRYDEYPELSSVEEAVKIGDYASAKAAIIAYYRSKSGESIYKYAPGGYSIYAEAMMDYICGFYELEDLMGQCFVGEEFAWHSIDLTHKGRATTGTYGLLDADMDGSSLEIYSKENGSEYAAYLSVTTEEGVTHKYPVVADTYISADENADTNYGSETILYCREESYRDDLPFCSDTKRPYFRVDLPQPINNARSITFNFYGRTNGDKPKKVYLTKNSTLATFIEDDLTWHQNDGNYTELELFNFKKTGFLFKRYIDMVGTEWQVGLTYAGWFSRFNQVEWLMGSYLDTGNEDYAYRALEFAMAQYNQQPGYRYSQALDSGWRIERIIRFIYSAINSEHMNNEVFTALLKWLYSHFDGYRGQTNWKAAANQVNAVLANLARIGGYFPEFINEEDWDFTKSVLKDFYTKQTGGTLFNPDGSYRESCSNYIPGVLGEIAGVVRTIASRDGIDHPDYKYFEECLLDLILYYSTLAYSTGQTIPYGDGGRNIVTGTIGELNDEFFNYDDLRYIATKGLEGTEPSYTSKLYPEKSLAMMRSGWDTNSICALITNTHGGSHTHKDDLALDVTAFGTPLLVDAGVGSYSPAVDFTAIQAKTELHNTIVIDGQDQTIMASYDDGGFMEMKSNRGFDWTHASTEKSYPGFDMHRKVVLLKNKFIIVSDTIENLNDTDTHNYSIYWHPDYNQNLTYDTVTGAVKTTHSGSPNVKIFSPGNTPDIHNRWMSTAGGRGIAQSRSVRYSVDTSEPVHTFDTVIYPQNKDIDDDIRTTKLSLDCTNDVATALQININSNVGTFYSSNEETPSLRNFNGYSFDGEMAYVEKDNQNKPVYIAFTEANEISEGSKKLVYSASDFSDFCVLYGFDTLKLYGSAPLTGDVTIVSDKEYAKVTYNDSPVAFTYNNGYITTNGTPYVEGESNPVNPGSPSSPQRPSSPSLGGGGGGGGTGKDDTDKDDETVNSGANVPSDGNIPSDGNATSDGNVTSDAKPAYKVFDDCKDHWAKDYISSLCAEGIISGKTETEFMPESSITRAEFAKLIVGVLGIKLPEKYTKVFSDVSSDAWYAPYVNAAFREGIISGYEDSTFNPDRLVTRQEMAKMLCIAAEIESLVAKDEASEFSDASFIAEWAKEYVSKASALGFFKGDEEGRFNPSSSATRAEAATVIYRFLEFSQSKGDETK